MIELCIKKLYSDVKLPVKAHEDDACFDIFAYLHNDVGSMIIKPHETVVISTGFATEIPKGYWGAIFARSGLSSKKGLRPIQGVAVIDAGYRGEWKVLLHNDTEEMQIISNGERIAQFMLLECPTVKLIETVTLNEDTERGSGGFGSSGKF